MNNSEYKLGVSGIWGNTWVSEEDFLGKHSSSISLYWAKERSITTLVKVVVVC